MRKLYGFILLSGTLHMRKYCEDDVLFDVEEITVLTNHSLIIIINQ